MTKLHPERSRPILVYVLEGYLRLLHPFMPFITEELWQRVPHEGESVVIAPYPEFDASMVDPDAEADIAQLEEIVVKVRNIRAEMNVDPKTALPLRVAVDGTGIGEMIERNREYVRRLARVGEIEVVRALSGEKGAAQAVAGSVSLEIPLAGVMDLDAERARLSKELDKVLDQISGLERKLSNASFVERAPVAVVEENRQRLADYESQAARLRDGLHRLS
jgi:valyl-tRNA synthetase